MRNAGRALVLRSESAEPRRNLREGCTENRLRYGHFLSIREKCAAISQCVSAINMSAWLGLQRTCTMNISLYTTRPLQGIWASTNQSVKAKDAAGAQNRCYSASLPNLSVTHCFAACPGRCLVFLQDLHWWLRHQQHFPNKSRHQGEKLYCVATLSWDFPPEQLILKYNGTRDSSKFSVWLVFPKLKYLMSFQLRLDQI